MQKEDCDNCLRQVFSLNSHHSIKNDEISRYFINIFVEQFPMYLSWVDEEISTMCVYYLETWLIFLINSNSLSRQKNHLVNRVDLFQYKY